MNTGKALIGGMIAAVALLGFTGVGYSDEHEHHHHGVTEAIAVLHPTQGNAAHGTVRFTQDGAKVKIVAVVEGLAPNSVHGFHIHEYGDCSAPDASSAGGHFNPEGHKHGGPDAKDHHAGDLGNLKSDEHGTARLEIIVEDISVAGAKNPILGLSVILHAKADDMKSQPTGESGSRIACGVIGVAKPAPAATPAPAAASATPAAGHESHAAGHETHPAGHEAHEKK